VAGRGNGKRNSLRHSFEECTCKFVHTVIITKKLDVVEIELEREGEGGGKKEEEEEEGR
jgi:hypothetical protein